MIYRTGKNIAMANAYISSEAHRAIIRFTRLLAECCILDMKIHAARDTDRGTDSCHSKLVNHEYLGTDSVEDGIGLQSILKLIVGRHVLFSPGMGFIRGSFVKGVR